ncbi:MAG: Transcription accessory protein (S1 RNA-binding domain) [uncultured Sulfurovum sp.]|uniref:Transcription accessory protein (S1 RNA-binding domain) n=1 Tax=uncultured Sulfurovum sp. TaxID=269237 RepID=A0A6S6U0C5_9BACT|nr:MAG: Transcription accessory protein (S1 RNA-binding domain) [uncultured Sulfurovum sp.]
MQTLIENLHVKTKLQKTHIQNILTMLEEGATIPFIARYRKEMTGGATDEILRDFETVYLSAKNLLQRKEEILRLIEERSKLTQSLKKSILEATTLRMVEDIYRPFKEKKNTRAMIAMQNGLKPLALTLLSCRLSLSEFRVEAKKYVKNKIKNSDDAIQGAQDILAERYAEEAREREAIRNSMLKFGLLVSKKSKNFNDNGIYAKFLDHSEKVAFIPSHRYLAIMRGVYEKELSVKISIDKERILENIKKYKIPKNASTSKELLFNAYKDGLSRLLLPSIEREVQALLKEKADFSAITVFGKNLKQLLLNPPVVKRVILGVDPAFRTGCKLAVIDENGNYLEHAVIYPTDPRNEYEKSKTVILTLIDKYNIKAVAIGNGTASQETQAFFAKINEEEGKHIEYTVVSEAGASVYSASDIAMQEYPDLDVTIRGAISIAQRLRDPMAALVKIDPKSLGIGQYQHDVNQKLLEKKLNDVTQDLVNAVGVDVNSASYVLLSHVAGLSEKVAQNIVSHRDADGYFSTKSQLLKVKGLGAKAYEQAAGFIRIKDGDSIFDNTGIHPESYEIAKLLKTQDLETIHIQETKEKLGVGESTLKDIIKELQKPGFDPRDELPAIPFKVGLTDISMLHVGSIVSGVVRNIADFGAFVDIGLKNDGMIHISKMSQKRISHPLEVLSVNQFLPQIQVISIDEKSAKVGLSIID